MPQRGSKPKRKSKTHRLATRQTTTTTTQKPYYERIIRRWQKEGDTELAHMMEDDILHTFINDICKGKISDLRTVKQVSTLLKESILDVPHDRWFA
jgi:hypothetical protein